MADLDELSLLTEDFNQSLHPRTRTGEFADVLGRLGKGSPGKSVTQHIASEHGMANRRAARGIRSLPPGTARTHVFVTGDGKKVTLKAPNAPMAVKLGKQRFGDDTVHVGWRSGPMFVQSRVPSTVDNSPAAAAAHVHRPKVFREMPGSRDNAFGEFKDAPRPQENNPYDEVPGDLAAIHKQIASMGGKGTAVGIARGMGAHPGETQQKLASHSSFVNKNGIWSSSPVHVLALSAQRPSTTDTQTLQQLQTLGDYKTADFGGGVVAKWIPPSLSRFTTGEHTDSDGYALSVKGTYKGFYPNATDVLAQLKKLRESFTEDLHPRGRGGKFAKKFGEKIASLKAGGSFTHEGVTVAKTRDGHTVDGAPVKEAHAAAQIASDRAEALSARERGMAAQKAKLKAQASPGLVPTPKGAKFSSGATAGPADDPREKEFQRRTEATRAYAARENAKAGKESPGRPEEKNRPSSHFQKLYDSVVYGPKNPPKDQNSPEEGDVDSRKSAARVAINDISSSEARALPNKALNDIWWGLFAGGRHSAGHTVLKTEWNRRVAAGTIKGQRANISEASMTDKRLDEAAFPGAGAPEIESPGSLEGVHINELAKLASDNWRDVPFAAQTYLDAMRGLRYIEQPYGHDPGSLIVRSFLSNAGTWTGTVATAVKSELARRLASLDG